MPPASARRKKNPAYEAESIKTLSDVEHVRRRPGMWIGSTEEPHHLLVEALDNAIDEAIIGETSRIEVTLNTDEGWADVQDFGRGIPVATNKKTGRSTMLMAVDTLKTGGKFGGDGVYQTSAGLHGVGVKATNFLSEWFEVEVSRGGKLHTARYEQGRNEDGASARKIPPKHKLRGKTGTRIRFKPDAEIFDTIAFDPGKVAELLEEASYTCPDCVFALAVDGELTEYHNPEGLKGRLEKLLADSEDAPEPQHEPLHVVNEDGTIEVVMVWTNSIDEDMRSYVNTKFVREGGTHEQGLRRAITTILQRHKDSKGLLTDDFRAGLYAVIHYKCNNPQFRGQTKDKLQTKGAAAEVSGAVQPFITQLFKDNPELERLIIERARALKSARRKFKDIKATLDKLASESRSRMPMPDKAALAPSCKPQDRELFLVEGDSAGGTAKRARDTSYQEVLPLRGKVINAQRSQPPQVLANKEIQAIAVMIGAGLDQVKTGDGCDPESGRVGKVFLLMDADSDGLHIASLVLAFLWTYMLPMVRAGRVFIVDSPLYRGTRGRERVYGSNLDEIQEQLPGASITRFKGHGEANPADLREYAMNPETRRAFQVTESRLARAQALMGSSVEPRRELLGLVPKPALPPGHIMVGGKPRKIRDLPADKKARVIAALKRVVEA